METVISIDVGGSFVYVEPEKTGESYVVARIMQKRGEKILLNAFFRPSEVLSGRSFHPRLLVASTQSKWYFEKQMAGECQVLHISQIYDLERYCAKEDAFYFEQLYDLYAKEIYDVVRSNLSRSPEENVESLVKFPFIYTEVGHTLEIINAYGWCGICTSFCRKSDDDYFECAGCRNRYHFHCFNPRDLSDPSQKMCNVCHKESKSTDWIATIDSNQKLLTTYKDFDTTPLDVESMNLEWPFRYFGINTNEKSSFDTDNSIVFPRSSVKVGPSLQVAIPRFIGDGDFMDVDEVSEDRQEDVWLSRYGKGLLQQMEEEEQVDRSNSAILKYKITSGVDIDAGKLG
eukprot:NODE_9_length_64580_cov_1.431941.p19 type:complete len:344 gc:universal NODE_9_length_64580_cov_1.431941:35929-36960(+)